MSGPPLPRRHSSISLSVAANKLADRIKDVLEEQIRHIVPDGQTGYLDVTISGMNHAGRFAVVVEARLREPGDPEPDGPEVHRYVLR